MNKPKFSSDHHFLIGKSHTNSGKPCQDFALSGFLTGDEATCIIVSDGCSSGRHTDMGSRIIAFALERAIESRWNIHRSSNDLNLVEEVNFYQLMIANGMKDACGLVMEDLLATSSYFFASENGATLQIQGDGVYAIVYKNGNIETTRFDWNKNMPCYPIYQNDCFRTFVSAQGGNLEAEIFKSESVLMDSVGVILSKGEKPYTLSQSLKGFTRRFSIEELFEIEYLVIFSDGVTQMQGMDWTTAVKELVSFKTNKGDFAKRRLTNFVKTSSKNGHEPLDDISMAATHISFE